MQMTTLPFLLKTSVYNSEPLTFTQTALLPQGFPIGKVTALKYCIAGLQEFQCHIHLPFRYKYYKILLHQSCKQFEYKREKYFW